MIDVPDSELGELGRLIVAWADSERFPPNQTEVARELRVTKSMVGTWLRGDYKHPLKPYTLDLIAKLTHLPLHTVMDAVLYDAGYPVKPPIGPPKDATVTRIRKSNG